MFPFHHHHHPYNHHPHPTPYQPLQSGNEFDHSDTWSSMAGSNSNLSSCCGTSGGCSSCSCIGSPGSSPSLCSNSLKSGFFSPPVSSPSGLSDSDYGPPHRVFSSGDLQGSNGQGFHHQREGSPITTTTILEGMAKASKYSPEEKRERIARYRSKRNQRNFTKKIQYTCRKTLADSRPRIRGRFARNDEINNNEVSSTTSLNQWNYNDVNIGGSFEFEDDEDDDMSWISILDALSSNSSFITP